MQLVSKIFSKLTKTKEQSYNGNILCKIFSKLTKEQSSNGNNPYIKSLLEKLQENVIVLNKITNCIV